MDAPETRIGDLQVSYRAGELRGPSSNIRIDPRPMGVFRYLRDHAGEFCSREALFEAAWPGRVVSDTTLTAAISELRRSLRQAGTQHVRIETRSKHGYRLVCDAPSESAPEHASFPVTRRNHLPLYALGLVALLAVGILGGATVLTQQAPPQAVRLDYEFVGPDGERHRPSILLEAGKTGAVRLESDEDDSVLDLQVRVLDLQHDRVRLNTQFGTGRSHVGLLHVLPFESQRTVTLPASGANQSDLAVSVRATSATLPD